MHFKKIIMAALLLHISMLGYGQIPKVSYGSNQAAGKYYNIRGIKMYAEVYGTGTPLLLIHGNGGDISAFSRNIPYFARKYKVIAVDSRSQGKSVDLKSDLTFEQMADDFAALLDAMHIQKAYVLGWSDGGINAIIMAMRHPDKVIKLASTGANLWPGPTAFPPADWASGVKYYETNKNKVWRTQKEKNAWKMFVLDFKQPNIKLADLKKVKCPALIIAGDHDVILDKHTRLIYKNIPGAKLWIVPNSSHSTLIDHADAFNKMVDAFFAGK